MKNETETSDSPRSLIEVRELHKTYSGGRDALNGASLEVQRGQVYGLVGPNGAGKTTLIKILLGLLRCRKGTAHLFGKPFGKSSPAERARVASVSQEHSAYPSMTVSEICHYLSGFYPLWDQTFADHLRGRFELPADAPLGQLSGGERRRASILLALATRSQVLIMDEPAANLDPMARRALLEELAGVLADREGTTVLFSTHILSDLERIADTIGVLQKGVITNESSVENLTSNVRKIQVIFTESAMPKGFSLPEEAGPATCEGNVYTVLAGVPPDDFKHLRSQAGVQVQTFPVSLEDALLELMESSKKEMNLNQTVSVWRAILWREWLQHKKAVYGLVTVWIFLFFAFPLMGTPAELLLSSGLVALLIGWRLGSSDTREDAEEFSITLPARRMDYFQVRAIAGAALTFCFVVSGVVMSYASPRLWGIVVESGMAEIRTAGGPEWDFIAVSGSVLGLYLCSFATTLILPRRFSTLSIPANVLFHFAWGFVGVCGIRVVEGIYLGDMSIMHRGPDRGDSYGWAAGALVAGAMLLAVARFDLSVREVSARTGQLRLLIILMSCIIWAALIFLLASYNDYALQAVSRSDFLLGMTRFRLPIVGAGLVGIFVVWVWGLWSARSTDRLRAEKSGGSVLLRRIMGLTGVAGLIWLAVTHHSAVRDGYAMERMKSNSVEFPLPGDGTRDGRYLHLLLHVTPVFEPDFPLAVLPITINAEQLTSDRSRDVNGSVEVLGENLDVEFRITEQPFWTDVSCKRQWMNVKVGEFDPAILGRLLAEIKITAATELESAIPLSGESGGGFVVMGEEAGNSWRWREQGISRSYRLWVCAFHSDQEAGDPPISIGLDDMIGRTQAWWADPSTPRRQTMVVGPLLERAAFLLIPSQLATPLSRIRGADLSGLNNAEELLIAMQWPALIALGCAALVALWLNRYRKRAFLAMVVGVVGLFAVLDRASVQHASSHIDDPEATLHQKRVAASKLTRAFFWKTTALDALERARYGAAEDDKNFYDQMIEPLSDHGRL